MAAAPRWRIVACISAPENTASSVGAFSAILDLATPERQPPNAQVTVLNNPTLAEFKDAVTSKQANFVYVCGPSSQQADKPAGVLGPFRFADQPDGGEDVLMAALQAAREAEVAYVDATVSPHFGPALHHRGIPHVVVWPAGRPIPAVVAAQFNAAFVSFLTCTAASPAEAFAASSHGAQAHCSSAAAPAPAAQNGAGAEAADAAAAGADGGSGYCCPPLPAFVSASRPALPDSSSIPALVVPELRLVESRLTSYPGWSDVRLLAPRAELRLLLVGGAPLIDAVRLGFLGEALRALLVMEARALRLLSRTQLDRLPRNLPAGCGAVRCEWVATSSGARGSVVLGAPQSVLQHDALVQHALRMTLVTDSVSLQFRLPPPGLSSPSPRRSKTVAGGVPVVDTVVVTSVWAVEVLRALCREPRYHSLAALGIAAVGNLAAAAFSPADVRRLEVVVSGLGPPQPATATTSISELAPGASALEALPSPAAEPPSGGGAEPAAASAPDLAAAGVPDLAAAAASGGAYYGNDALMGYALSGQLQAQGGGADDASPSTSGAAGGGLDGPSGPYGGGAGGGGAGSVDGPPPDGGAPGSAAGGDGAGMRVVSRPPGPLSDKRPSFTGDLPGYTCRRPPLASCTEVQFYDDLVEFLTVLRGKPLDRARFPEAVLNGVSLDLFSLYREVVTRGGFRVGNGINWKGQVFPRMRNWTETNKQTGVGNALKRHYQNYLWEYEVAHPEDVTLDRCVLCNGGDAVSSDWVCCDACENWAHFSCDKRPGIGAFKDYAQGQGRVYVCPSCAREQEAGEALKRQRTA